MYRTLENGELHVIIAVATVFAFLPAEGGCPEAWPFASFFLPSSSEIGGVSLHTTAVSRVGDLSELSPCQSLGFLL